MTVRQTISTIPFENSAEMTVKEFQGKLSAALYEAGELHGELTISFDSTDPDSDGQAMQTTLYVSGHPKHNFFLRAGMRRECAICDFAEGSDVHR